MSISDPNEKYSCSLKSYIEQSYGKEHVISGKCHCNPDTTTTSKPNPGACCKSLHFSSTGSLAEGGQNHVLGFYNKISDGPEGYWNYQLMDGYKPKLWYYVYKIIKGQQILNSAKFCLHFFFKNLDVCIIFH